MKLYGRDEKMIKAQILWEYSKIWLKVKQYGRDEKAIKGDEKNSDT